jgi:hypothetical protein
MSQDVNYDEERIIGEVKEPDPSSSEDEDDGKAYDQPCISCKQRVISHCLNQFQAKLSFSLLSVHCASYL